MSGNIRTVLFDVNTFKLENHYPRRSIAHDAKPFSKQPLTTLYLVLYVPFCLFIVPVYATCRWIFLRAFVPTAPHWSLLDFVFVYTTRHTLWYWWSTTNGGLRGLYHTNLTENQRKWRRYLFKAMPDEIQPFSHKDLCEPMRSLAIETGAVEVIKTVPTWWIGHRSDALHQRRAKDDETLLIYLTG